MSRESRLAIAQGIGAGLQNVAQGYVQGKERQAAQRQQEIDMAAYNDPRTPRIQKAIIASKYAGAPAGAALIKSGEREALGREIFGTGGPTIPGQNAAPNVSQMQKALQAAEPVGQGVLAPNADQQVQQAMEPQLAPTQTPSEKKGLERFTDEQLKEAIGFYPEYGRAFEEELKDRREGRKAQQKEQQFEYGKQQDVRKETQKYVEKVLDSYQGAKTSEAILGQMDQLASENSLTSPLMNNLLQKLGLPLGVLNNPDSEEFDKLANTLTRDIQKFYGSRILASEFNNFLRQIPSLQNSEEGRKRIIDNLQKMLLPAKFEYQAYKEILKENGGKRPPNLREQIMDRMEPILDKWAQDFKSDINKSDPTKVPEGTFVIIAPDGRRVAVPKEHVATALAQGGQLE